MRVRGIIRCVWRVLVGVRSVPVRRLVRRVLRSIGCQDRRVLLVLRTVFHAHRLPAPNASQATR
jgi:hypothetical protein